MTVKELIAHLERATPEAIVIVEKVEESDLTGDSDIIEYQIHDAFTYDNTFRLCLGAGYET